MKLGRETEIKLEVRDPKALKARLKKLGARQVRSRHFESNQLFDFRDLRLRKARCLLRLRFMDGRCLLTFKGAPKRSRRYKVRGEIETQVANGTRLRMLLEGLGLREAFRYEKYRTVFAPGRNPGRNKFAEIDFDETPVGNYLELEGPKRWIDRMARELGYQPKDYIKSSYAKLYFEWCRREAKKPGNMVFRRHKY